MDEWVDGIDGQTNRYNDGEWMDSLTSKWMNEMKDG